MWEGVACAVEQARKSSETFPHGAALLDGKRVLSVGRNRNDNACGLTSIHAEMDAVWKLWKPRRARHAVVVRLRRDQSFGNSRPCPGCARLLYRLGIDRVTYSTDDPLAPLVTRALTDLL